MHRRQVGFYFDQSRCSGCLTCILACKQWHSSASEARNWRRVLSIEEGRYPHLKISFFSFSCFHCQTPLCQTTCPNSAIEKKVENGIVTVSPDLCLGEQACGLCKESCPYHVPVYNPEAGLKMEKCDLCNERMVGGKRPICVEACPMHALDAGDLAEMERRYGGGREADGFDYSLETGPSILLKRK